MKISIDRRVKMVPIMEINAGDIANNAQLIQIINNLYRIMYNSQKLFRLLA